LDDDDGLGQGGDEAVSIQKRAGEDVARGRIGIFADQCPVFGDRAEERDVVGRVSAAKPGGEYGDGDSTGVEAAAVCSGIDAVRASGHHDASGHGELAGEFAREAECVFIGGAGADDGDRTLEFRERAREVELSRACVWGKIEQSRRPT
jgi:hypothetical protein